MAAPQNEALIDLELMLAKKLVGTWHRVWVKHAKKMKVMLREGRFDDAHDEIDKLDFAPIARKHKKMAKTIGNAALSLGASRITGESKNKLSGMGRQDTLAFLMDQFEIMLERNATEYLRQKGHQIIEDYRKKQSEIEKAEPVVATIGAIGSLGDDFAHLASNVHTSRLNTFGFLATAMEQNLTHYEISEVMDSRTCPVCREMHGKVFTVSQGVQHAMTIMQNNDPDSLRLLAPWPSQSKRNVANLSQMSADEMATNGLSLPPYHPGCRGIVTTTTERVTSSASVTPPTTSLMPQDSIDEALSSLAGASKAKMKDTTDLIRQMSTYKNISKLTDSEVYAIGAYTHKAVYPVNMALRTGAITEEVAIYKDVLEAGLKKMPAAKGTVYRGIHAGRLKDEAAFFQKYAVGEEVTESAFTSVATSRDVAAGFSGDIMMVIESKSSRKISGMSVFSTTEAESVFLPGTRFRVTAVDKEGRLTTIFMEELDGPDT